MQAGKRKFGDLENGVSEMDKEKDPAKHEKDKEPEGEEASNDVISTDSVDGMNNFRQGNRINTNSAWCTQCNGDQTQQFDNSSTSSSDSVSCNQRKRRRVDSNGSAATEKAEYSEISEPD